MTEEESRRGKELYGDSVRSCGQKRRVRQTGKEEGERR
jgi:hypothetical protein